MKKENESEVVVAQTCYSTDRKVTIGNEDNLNIEKSRINAITEVRPSKKSKTLTLDKASEYNLLGMRETFPNITRFVLSRLYRISNDFQCGRGN